jgi:stress-induced morphogen
MAFAIPREAINAMHQVVCERLRREVRDAMHALRASCSTVSAIA